MRMSEAQKLKIYNELVEKHYKDLYRYAYKITNNEAVSEDVVQETLIRVWTSLESLNELSKAKSWMITILRRENLRRVAKEKVNETDCYDDMEYLISDNNDLERDLDKEIVFKNINDLKDCYKEPLILQIVYGYSVEEISEKLGLNENTVSTRLFRGKSLLEKKMSTFLKVNQKETVFI